MILASAIHIVVLSAIIPFSIGVAGATIKQTGLESGWKYKGCYTPNTSPNILNEFANPSSVAMTPNFCLSDVQSRDLRFAGLSYGYLCTGGSNLLGSPTKVDDSFCTTYPCPQSPGDACGGNNYTLTYAHYAIKKTGLPTHWHYVGCYKDQSSPRLLSAYTFNTGPMTATTCINACNSRGYPLAAVQYGGECWCDNTFHNNLGTAPESECSTSCSGDEYEYCGGTWRAQVYSYEP
ncbi:WSC domain-containing protein [Cladochytrium replicatum]|nr:WSC domain-containing protein [Cladochytrium replicatum]